MGSAEHVKNDTFEQNRPFPAKSTISCQIWTFPAKSTISCQIWTFPAKSTRSDQIWPDLAKSDRIQPEPARASQTLPESTRSGQTLPESTRSGQTLRFWDPSQPTSASLSQTSARPPKSCQNRQKSLKIDFRVLPPSDSLKVLKTALSVKIDTFEQNRPLFRKIDRFLPNRPSGTKSTNPAPETGTNRRQNRVKKSTEKRQIFNKTTL